jgi:hypothetical protein
VTTPAGGGEIVVETLAAASIHLPETGWVAWKVQHDDLGFIRFFVDSGGGYAPTPLLEARDADNRYPELGHFGWLLDSEAPAPFDVDWITAR